jgi:hypothetical protein
MVKIELRILVAVGTAALPVLAGCKDKAEDISSSEHLLARQHQVWEDALETLGSSNPNYNLVAAAGGRLRRTLLRVEKDYTGGNKEQVIAKLQDLADKFDAAIAPKLTMTRPQVVLQPDVTAQELKTAFEKLAGEYEQLKTLTSEG